MIEVSTYEAKTHLAELLRQVKGGERVLITKHHIPIAVIMPAPAQEQILPAPAQELIIPAPAQDQMQA